MPEIVALCNILSPSKAGNDLALASAALDATYRPIVMIYSVRRPRMSAASPTNAGAMVDMTMYEVTVRLIFDIETSKSCAIAAMAG